MRPPGPMLESVFALHEEKRAKDHILQKIFISIINGKFLSLSILLIRRRAKSRGVSLQAL
jgi:hypothetical protein